jgi:hypothetical protein
VTIDQQQALGGIWNKYQHGGAMCWGPVITASQEEKSKPYI